MPTTAARQKPDTAEPAASRGRPAQCRRQEADIAFPPNTGVPSGYDLNNDGQVGTSDRSYGDDAFGFGVFPGQYGFALLSQYPISAEDVRTFQLSRWADMPGARLPDDPKSDYG